MLEKQTKIISAYMPYLPAGAQTTAIVLPIHCSVPAGHLVHLPAPIIHQPAEERSILSTPQSFLKGTFLGTPSPVTLHTLGMQHQLPRDLQHA
jgi:hypothetical protein